MGVELVCNAVFQQDELFPSLNLVTKEFLSLSILCSNCIDRFLCQNKSEVLMAFKAESQE